MTVKYPFPKAILFDWDNTLMDTTPILYKAFCVLRQHYNLPEYSMEEYQKRTVTYFSEANTLSAKSARTLPALSMLPESPS